MNYITVGMETYMSVYLCPRVEISKAVDMYMFLFDDILLLTRVKKPPRKVRLTNCLLHYDIWTSTGMSSSLVIRMLLSNKIAFRSLFSHITPCALEALRNALYKFKTYFLTYLRAN